jgi:quercetin dioxygenase-like cupin family protein
MYIVHEQDFEAKDLPGRKHKMIVGPKGHGKAKNMCFGVADFPPNSHAPEHVHPKEEEVIYFLSGYGEMFFNGKGEKIKKGSIAYIPPKVTHSIKNDSDQVMHLAYVFSPPVEQGSYDKK